MKKLLRFGFGNAKLIETIATFSLPSGFTCPCANECLSKANRETGKITDGPENKFRCFSASQEAVFPSLRASRWTNFDLLKECKTLTGMVDLISDSLEPIAHKIAKVRVHVAGDFFSDTYFQAWMNIAKMYPHLIFYGYTKRVGLLVKYKKELPTNFRFVASWGGKEDRLIKRHKIKSAKVVFTEAEAAALGLELDHADDHAYSTDTKSFALLLHGTQPKGTPANEAWQVIKKAGKGYNMARREATGIGANK
jgi:hypothetical protein